VQVEHAVDSTQSSCKRLPELGDSAHRLSNDSLQSTRHAGRPWCIHEVYFESQRNGISSDQQIFNSLKMKGSVTLAHLPLIPAHGLVGLFRCNSYKGSGNSCISLRARSRTDRLECAVTDGGHQPRHLDTESARNVLPCQRSTNAALVVTADKSGGAKAHLCMNEDRSNPFRSPKMRFPQLWYVGCFH
jgi:hypothetical protein